MFPLTLIHDRWDLLIMFQHQLDLPVGERAELDELHDAVGHAALAEAAQVLDDVVRLQAYRHGRVQTVRRQLVLVDVLWPGESQRTKYSTTHKYINSDSDTVVFRQLRTHIHT